MSFQSRINKILAFAVAAALLVSGSACKSGAGIKDGVVFTDSSGRNVTIPKEITRIAPSGAVATMLLAAIAPEYLVSVNATPSSSQYEYLPEELMKLPTTGQMYGSKSTINLEALLKAKPQLIIDLGDKKDGIAGDMDGLQKQTGISVIFIEADLAHMAAAFRSLGSILSGKAERGEQIAAFVDETVTMAKRNAAQITQPLSVMYTSGTSGLDTNARGSTQAQVIEMIGASNAIVVDDVSDRGGGNTINFEQLYNFDPDVIIFAPGSVYGEAGSSILWQELRAIRESRYYEIPGRPYNWMSGPPSVNMLLGIWWLGNLLYPEIYDYDMAQKAREIYRLLWGYDLSNEEAADMLKFSINTR